MQDDEVLSGVQALANFLGLSLSNTYELARRPDFPAIRITARRIVFLKGSVVRWLQAQEGSEKDGA